MVFEMRERNLEIFADTLARCSGNPVLRDSVRNSRRGTRIIPEEEALILPDNPNRRVAVKISESRSLEAAGRYSGRKVCVLNFASATNPGGGVEKGSSAQEESLCRCSTLFPVLRDPEWMRTFYLPHRIGRNPLYNDDVLYSPGITVFKRDRKIPEYMPEEEWFSADILTCAAPNLRRAAETDPYTGQNGAGDRDLDRTFLSNLLRKRTGRILAVAAKEKCEILILGAFGCGAFRNPPELVAKAFSEAVKEYGGYFETIEFAVFHFGTELRNYQAFCEAFPDAEIL